MTIVKYISMKETKKKKKFSYNKIWIKSFPDAHQERICLTVSNFSIGERFPFETFPCCPPNSPLTSPL